ncbi:MAG TPA: hypothetical protein PKM78_16515 [Anaerolineae bacterium]|nr:hypothetical protein [Anaerolineae bacterium]HNU05938.1 hypothetical protein [Anaerolineae bacterium]
MSPGKKTLHWLIIILAALAMILSVAGIVGAWWLHNTATDVTVRAFAVADTAVGVVDTGAERANELVQRGRSEIQQVESTIVAAGANIAESNPLLTGLSNRLSERMGPTVEQIRTTLAPVTDTLRSVRSLVDFINTFPLIRQTPPAVEELERALNRLDETAADVRQIGDIVHATVTGAADRLTNQTVDTLTGLTGRVDSRLAEAQAAVEQAQAEITALQAEMTALRARLLLIYNLTALGLTLFLLWVIYSQWVVMRQRWQLLHAAGQAAVVEETPAAAPAAVLPAAAPTAVLPAAPPAAVLPAAAPLPVVIERVSDIPQEEAPREAELQEGQGEYKMEVAATAVDENIAISSPRSQYLLRVFQDPAEVSYSIDITINRDWSRAEN